MKYRPFINIVDNLSGKYWEFFKAAPEFKYYYGLCLKKHIIYIGIQKWDDETSQWLVI